jgi:hypothetical protein
MGLCHSYADLLEKYHIYEISREHLHMNDIHIDTTPYLKQYMKFTQDNTIHPLPTLSPLPSTPVHYKYRSKHTTQGKTTTQYADGVNGIQTRG